MNDATVSVRHGTKSTSQGPPALTNTPHYISSQVAGCQLGLWNLIASFSVEGDDVLGGLSLPLGSGA